MPKHHACEAKEYRVGKRCSREEHDVGWAIPLRSAVLTSYPMMSARADDTPQCEEHVEHLSKSSSVLQGEQANALPDFAGVRPPALADNSRGGCLLERATHPSGVTSEFKRNAVALVHTTAMPSRLQTKWDL